MEQFFSWTCVHRIPLFVGLTDSLTQGKLKFAQDVWLFVAHFLSFPGNENVTQSWSSSITCVMIQVLLLPLLPLTKTTLLLSLMRKIWLTTTPGKTTYLPLLKYCVRITNFDKIYLPTPPQKKLPTPYLSTYPFLRNTNDKHPLTKLPIHPL